MRRDSALETGRCPVPNGEIAIMLAVETKAPGLCLQHGTQLGRMASQGGLGTLWEPAA